MKVPTVEPVYVTVTMPGTPIARFSGLGVTLKPAPVAVQLRTAELPLAVKLKVDCELLVGNE